MKVLLLMLLMVSMFAYSYQQSPCVQPCSCSKPDGLRMDMDCSGRFNKTTQMRYGAFWYNKLDLSRNKFKILNISKIDAFIVNLEKSSIEVIDPNSFESSFIRKLYLNENLLTKIESNVFNKLRNNLTELDLSSNKLEVLPSFKNLKVLERVNLKYNRIRDIFDATNNCGIFPRSIININLRKNELTSIESYTFEGLNQLTVLDLGKNRIETIQNGSFKLPRLQTLDLSENYLTSFEQRTFHGMDDCFIDLSTQHKKVLINDYTFDANNRTLLTFNMSNNKFLYESSSPICINRPNSSEFTTTYYLNSVDIENINPCFLAHFIDAIQESEIRLINTKSTNCDCDVLNYFRSLNEKCHLKCSDTGLSTSDCVQNQNAPIKRDICSKYYDKCQSSSLVSRQTNNTIFIIIICVAVFIGLIAIVIFIIICKRNSKRKKPTENLINAVHFKPENYDENNYIQAINPDNNYVPIITCHN